MYMRCVKMEFAIPISTFVEKAMKQKGYSVGSRKHSIMVSLTSSL